MTPEPVKEQPKEQPQAEKSAPVWKLKQAPRFSAAFLHPSDGPYWETEYTDGKQTLITRGDTAEESLKAARAQINRRNK